MLTLSEPDRAMLAGDRGPAAQLAMSIVVRMAAVYGASALMDVSQAHIDSTIYLGDATLEFAERLASLGARVAVPTSLNVSGVDECGWKDWVVSPEWAAKAARQMLRMSAWVRPQPDLRTTRPRCVRRLDSKWRGANRMPSRSRTR
jgi:predicted aconitase